VRPDHQQVDVERLRLPDDRTTHVYPVDGMKCNRDVVTDRRYEVAQRVERAGLGFAPSGVALGRRVVEGRRCLVNMQNCQR
jgi:hypothetical protein